MALRLDSRHAASPNREPSISSKATGDRAKAVGEPRPLCPVQVALFAQELELPFARPLLFFDGPASRLDGCVKPDQICSRHFAGFVDPQSCAQPADRKLQIVDMFVVRHHVTPSILPWGIPCCGPNDLPDLNAANDTSVLNNSQFVRSYFVHAARTAREAPSRVDEPVLCRLGSIASPGPAQPRPRPARMAFRGLGFFRLTPPVPLPIKPRASSLVVPLFRGAGADAFRGSVPSGKGS
jgi:hypothetical protein